MQKEIGMTRESFYGLASLVFFHQIVPIFIYKQRNKRKARKGINNYHESLIKISSLCPSFPKKCQLILFIVCHGVVL